MNTPKLTHIDEIGASRMVDVGSKNVTERVAGIMAAKKQANSSPCAIP